MSLKHFFEMYADDYSFDDMIYKLYKSHVELIEAVYSSALMDIELKLTGYIIKDSLKIINNEITNELGYGNIKLSYDTVDKKGKIIYDMYVMNNNVDAIFTLEHVKFHDPQDYETIDDLRNELVKIYGEVVNGKLKKQIVNILTEDDIYL